MRLRTASVCEKIVHDVIVVVAETISVSTVAMIHNFPVAHTLNGGGARYLI